MADKPLHTVTNAKPYLKPMKALSERYCSIWLNITHTEATPMEKLANPKKLCTDLANTGLINLENVLLLAATTPHTIEANINIQETKPELII